jgi:hypothetical protein
VPISRRFRAVAVSAVSAVSCVLLAGGCSVLTGGLDEDRTPLTDDQVVGTWNGTNCQASLVFKADHSLQVTAYPLEADHITSKITKSVSGEGTWKIRPADRSTDTSQGVQLIMADSHHLVEPGKDGSTTVLFATVDDPDLGIACRYTRAS